MRVVDRSLAREQAPTKRGKKEQAKNEVAEDGMG